MTTLVWFLLLFGLAIGSFLNVCISRLPVDESVVTPGSRCGSCGTPIRWFDNIPIASYVALWGRCRQCRATIGARYPIVELTTVLAFGLQLFVHFPDLPLVAVRVMFTALLIVLFWTDVETRRLPNLVTIPGTALGIVSSVFVPPGIESSLAGVALGGGVLFLLRWVWLRATGVDGMGLGDVKMLAMIGAFLGWQQVIVVLFLSSVSGAIAGIVLVVAGGQSLRSSLPFGTFLAAAALVASVVGEDLFNWYLTTLQWP